MDTLPQQSVALLDVDHTLLFGNDDDLNEVLLHSLLERGVNRVYLFTDMTFNFHAIEERNRLVKTLEHMGFAVQGVITPNDLTWASVDVREVMKLHQMCFVDNSYSGKLYGDNFEQFITANRTVLSSIFAAITSYSPHACKLGEAFNEASLTLHAKGNLTDELKCRSVFAKVFTDHLSERLGYRHNKSLLLDTFVRQKPDWVSSIVLFDDNLDVIEDVKAFRPVAVGGTVGSVSTSTLTEITVPPVTIVPVTSASLTAEYYEALLAAHFEKCSAL
jgi:hypothetical protein